MMMNVFSNNKNIELKTQNVTYVRFMDTKIADEQIILCGLLGLG